MTRNVCEDSHGDSCMNTIIIILLFWERFFASKLVQTTLLKPAKQQCCIVANNLPCGLLYVSFTALWTRFCYSPLGIIHCKQERIVSIVINSVWGFQPLGFLVLDPQISRSWYAQKTWGADNGLGRLLTQSRLECFDQISLYLAKQLIKISF